MSIEQSLERIAAALEVIADSGVSGGIQQDTPDPLAKPAPAAKKATKKTAAKKAEATAPAGDEPSEDDLRLCFQEYVGKKGNEEGTAKLKELIGGYGATKIGEVKPKDYAEIIQEVKSWK